MVVYKSYRITNEMITPAMTLEFIEQARRVSK
jgi:hypothetical protein